MKADLPLLYEVRRTFPMSPRVSLGDIVDATNWQNRELLARQGYIIPVDPEPEPKKTGETKKPDSKTSEKPAPKEQKKQTPVKTEAKTEKTAAKKTETKSEAPAKPKKTGEKKAEGK